MRAWPAPDLPVLAGSGPPSRVFDTATRELRPLAPAATARMYVCGITPYDAAHIGHAWTYVVFDVLQRYWRDGGHQVRYVQNITDVDDPLLDRAGTTGEDWVALASRELEVFRDDMSALRVLPPDDFVGAVEAIPQIVATIGELVERQAAYQLDGDVYFPVSAAPRFGEVSHLDLASMVRLSRQNGGDPDRPGKKDPLDSLMWQGGRPGDPRWDSPFGRGRPGWHVECAAIALDRLGPGFDVQGGGRDLVFPHHEIGAAQMLAVGGRWPVARAFVHVGLVGLDGEKMSKSRGNLVFVSRLRAAGVPAPVIRLALLDHHYRTGWQWRPAELDRAADRWRRWRAAVGRPAGPAAAGLLAQLRGQLADDLRTPDALAAVDRWVAAAEFGEGSDPDAPPTVRDAVDALLGVDLR